MYLMISMIRFGVNLVFYFGCTIRGYRASGSVIAIRRNCYYSSQPASGHGPDGSVMHFFHSLQIQ